MNIYTPLESFNKLYRKQAIDECEFSVFKDELKELFGNIEDGQVEPTQRKFFTTFMEGIIPKNYLVTHEEDSIDVVLHTGEKTTSSKGVLIELKSTTNKEEMVTNEDINRKALQELLFYYLNERIGKQNNSIRYLIACNIYECFVWDAQIFEKTFYKNKPLLKEYDDFVNKRLDFTTRDKFYEQIAKKYIDEVKDHLDYTYINIRDCYHQYLHKSEKALIPLFKLLSATFLMKLSVRNDSNDLNNDFYRELLYIMGVEEWIDKETHKIRRIKNGAQKFSLMEQTWSKLDDYGISDKEQHFEIAMGLLITWINRILFLKLLESQLISFGNGEKAKFLTFGIIPDYDVLHDLFMKVLAKPLEERDEEIKEKFPLVPYLNSSLFEMSALEQKYFPIGMLRLGEMEVYKKTVLKDSHGKKVKGNISTLKYLFDFLDAYDFGASKVVDGIKTEKKTLINASVLGLIFEKINGYKDGSFFTPGYITEYICHKSLRRAVLDKFNEIKDWECKDFNDLKEYIGRKSEARNEANEIVNSLKICDPAVGSGHFLVSALNELIAIKSELGILQDRQERPMCIDDYDVRVENDELSITNEFDERFSYKPTEKRSRQIQEALFEEKRTIIENCLFGVDLNPKSVEICRLRLWIELLKSAYYYRTETGERALQTLPNIDINIKCGNSLASNQPVCIGRKIMVREGMKRLVTEYKQNVKEYKNCHSKDVKRKLNQDIQDIKRKLMPPVQLDAFANNKNIVSRNKTMQLALEWMIEFPEVLDEEGTFRGFDVIVGNPPYISLEKLKDDSITYNTMQRRNENNIQEKTYLTHESRGDIYTLFVERGLQLLRRGGHLSYILPNKWEKVMYGRPLRKLFLQNNMTHLIDFRDIQIFDDATTYTCIIRLKKEKAGARLNVSTMKAVNKDTLAQDVDAACEVFDKTEMDYKIWVTSSLAKFKLMQRIKEPGKTCSLHTFIKGEAYRGILSGLSDAFVVSSEKYEELVAKDIHSCEILRPFLQGRGLIAYGDTKVESYLLFIPKGFTLNGMGIEIDEEELKKQKKKKSEVIPSEEEAWTWFSMNYPAVAEWLISFRQKAIDRTDKGDYWWELRACDYYDKFEQPKIIYQRLQVKPCFTFLRKDTYCKDTLWFLSVPSKALLPLLNSKLGWWLITEFCPLIRGGRLLIWDNLSQIPIPMTLPEELITLATKVENATTEGDNDKLEQVKRDIDKAVYHLYHLTYDEILIIDPETPIKREEYEKHRDFEK